MRFVPALPLCGDAEKRMVLNRTGCTGQSCNHKTYLVLADWLHNGIVLTEYSRM